MKRVSFEDSFNAELEQEFGNLGPADAGLRPPARTGGRVAVPGTVAEGGGVTPPMIDISELACGIRLVTEKMPVRSACVGFWVGTGSRDETDAQAGISHFLEHLLFKGTPARSRAIAESIDTVGGDMNAYTTKEYTTFYMRLLAEDLPSASMSSATS